MTSQYSSGARDSMVHLMSVGTTIFSGKHICVLMLSICIASKIKLFRDSH